MEEHGILYIKPGCPWCTDAVSYFNKKGLKPVIKDVLTDREAMQRMVEITGQTRTPSFEYEEFVVADFSVDEFISAINRAPKVKEALGF